MLKLLLPISEKESTQKGKSTPKGSTLKRKGVYTKTKEFAPCVSTSLLELTFSEGTWCA